MAANAAGVIGRSVEAMPGAGANGPVEGRVGGVSGVAMGAVFGARMMGGGANGPE